MGPAAASGSRGRLEQKRREPAKAPAASRKGPAQVATDTYRDNWDSIWSAKKNAALN